MPFDTIIFYIRKYFIHKNVTYGNYKPQVLCFSCPCYVCSLIAHHFIVVNPKYWCMLLITMFSKIEATMYFNGLSNFNKTICTKTSCQTVLNVRKFNLTLWETDCSLHLNAEYFKCEDHTPSVSWRTYRGYYFLLPDCYCYLPNNCLWLCKPAAREVFEFSPSGTCKSDFYV